MDKISRLLLAALLVVNLAAAGAIGAVAYKVNELVNSVEATKTTLDETNAFVRENIQRAQQLTQDAQGIQERLKKFNPLAR